MKKLRVATMIGTAFEFFEFQVFAMLMPFLTHYFFNPILPASDQYLIGYVAFGIAFIVRPVGGVLFGYIGDYYGRKSAMLSAMWLMAISTVAIGLLPGFTILGHAAFVLLFLCRIAQGLSLGGEYASGGIFLYEHHHKATCYDLIWMDLGGMIGLFFATLIVMLSTQLFSIAQMQTVGWRIPFLAAFFLSVCGIYIRRSLSNTKTHDQLMHENKQRALSHYYDEALKNWRTLMLLIFACAPNGIFWYLHVIFIPNQLLHLSAGNMLPFIALSLVVTPIAAKLADNIGPYNMWIFSVIALVLNFGVLILHANFTLQMIGMGLQSILLAINQGPRFLILNTHFSLRIRGISCAIVYSFANIFGGITPFVALALLNHYHHAQPIFYLLLVAGTLAVTSMIISRSAN